MLCCVCVLRLRFRVACGDVCGCDVACVDVVVCDVAFDVACAGVVACVCCV